MEAKKYLLKIKREFPGLTWKNYEYINHGYDHAVIILDKKIVFRFPKSNKYKKILKDEIILLDYLNKRITANIPDYYSSAKNYSFAAYHFLQGRELTVHRFKKLPLVKTKDIAKQLALFLTQLHSIKQRGLKKFKIEKENGPKYFQTLVKDSKKQIFPGLKKSEQKALDKYFKQLHHMLSLKRPSTLIHNDLSDDHILLGKTKISIIDFSDRVIGDSARDFAWLWIYGNNFIKQVYKMYQGKKDKDFLSRSKTYLKIIPLQIMIAAKKGVVCEYKDGYNLFKKVFSL
jgi:aminoglycoside 2''-phosphotransferase